MTMDLNARLEIDGVHPQAYPFVSVDVRLWRPMAARRGQPRRRPGRLDLHECRAGAGGRRANRALAPLQPVIHARCSARPATTRSCCSPTGPHLGRGGRDPGHRRGGDGHAEDLRTERWRPLGTIRTYARFPAARRGLLARLFVAPRYAHAPRPPHPDAVARRSALPAVCGTVHGSRRFAMRLIGKRQSQANPNYCTSCESILLKHHGAPRCRGPACSPTSVGPPQLAEAISPTDYRHVLDRFYRAASDAVFSNDGMVDKFVGDG